VNRAPLDSAPRQRPAPELVFDHLMEGIGIALDLRGGRMFMTDLGGIDLRGRAELLELESG
jgi:hypothetical protein